MIDFIDINENKINIALKLCQFYYWDSVPLMADIFSKSDKNWLL